MYNTIKQTESRNSMVQRGTNWEGRRIPKKIIQKSLEFETLFKGIDEVLIDDSFSDYPPSYSLSLKIKDVIKIKDGFRRKSDGFTLCFEVFPQRDGYHLRDYRILKEYDGEGIFPFCNDKVSSLNELVELLFDSNLSLNVFTQMKMCGVSSDSEIPQNERTKEHRTKLSKETFDFDRDELKEKLGQRLEVEGFKIIG